MKDAPDGLRGLYGQSHPDGEEDGRLTVGLSTDSGPDYSGAASFFHGCAKDRLQLWRVAANPPAEWYAAI
jgi:hypothetical protein